MGLSAQIKDILNKFADTQIALRLPTLPLEASNPQLGDALDAAYSDAVRSATGVYDFATMGGGIGTKSLGIAIPAGAVITRLWTDTLTAMTSGGSATVALEAGATVLKSATAFDDASYVGVDAHTSGMPNKTSAGGNLEFVIAGAALTDGKVRVTVEYITP